MKRTIFLQLNYDYSPASRAKAITAFQGEVKKLPFIVILATLEPKAQIIVEFPDDRLQEAYDGLRALDSVAIIDFILPSNFSE
jgi:hypothetical protein